MVYTLEKGAIVEPDMPNRFAWQFDYDQLYAGNLNPELQYDETYFDACRAWYFNISGCICTRFWLPEIDAKPRLSLSFCR